MKQQVTKPTGVRFHHNGLKETAGDRALTKLDNDGQHKDAAWNQQPPSGAASHIHVELLSPLGHGCHTSCFTLPSDFGGCQRQSFFFLFCACGVAQYP